ncbi:MAG: DUF2799 domain-containing protein [Cohaesibacter sp.]|jgi:hypothetical protein|nr:DUF2799 domain-containing protein [Cohaesibacter sp.]
MRLFLAPLLLLVALSGCASLSEDECTNGDWYKMGQSDALEGRTTDRLADHAKACRRYGIEPDRQAYLQGRDIGLGQYCTIENGFRVGREGYGYNRICPVSREASFMSGYSRGKEIHQIELDMASVERDMASLRASLYEKPRKEKDAKPLSDTDKAQIRRDLARLQRELNRLEREREQALVSAETFLSLNVPET